MDGSDFQDYIQMCNLLTSAQQNDERLKAESVLITFLTNIENLQKLQFIMANVDSDAVIFVTCELLSKIVQQTRLEIVMSAPSDILENQPSPNASTITHFTQVYELFVKILLEKYMKIKSFTVNSIANLLGCILKKIWSEVKDNQLIVENIKPFFFTQNNPALENIGLRVYEQIISNISYYEPKDSYLAHRKVMISFQKGALTCILENVLEILYEDLPQIKDQTIDPNIGIQNLCQAFKVIFLCVHYNFSFSFLDLDIDYDASDAPFVNFPETWAKIISSPEVYELFYLSYLLISNFNEESSLLVLRSLNRLVSCRLTIFDNKEQTKSFRRGMFRAIFNFSKTLYQKANDAILLEITEANVRYLTNIGSRKARKQGVFEEWLDTLKDLTIMGFRSGCTITSTLPAKLFEMWRRLLKQIWTDKDLNVYAPKIEVYAYEVFSSFMDSVLNNSDRFFYDFQYDSSKKFRKQVISYFASIYDLFSIKLAENVKNINTILNGLMDRYNEVVNDPTAANFEPLFSTFEFNQLRLTPIDQLSTMFAIVINTHLTSNNNEKPVTREVPTAEESNYEGSNLALCFSIIKLTLDLQQNGRWISNRTFELLTLLFIENYVILTVDGLFAYKETDGISQSNARIHVITSQVLGTEDYSKTIELFVTKLANNLLYSDFYLLSYSLYLLKVVIIKLKSNSKRETFKDLNVLKILLGTLEQFNKSALFEKKYYNFRKKAYEIIAIAWLDDYFDNFLETIDKISQIIYQTNFPDNNITADGLVRFFKDSSGIVGYLDVSKIFKYYFKTTFPLYLTIIENHLPLLLDDFDVLTSFLDFYFALSQNQSSRLSSDPNSQLGYQIFITFGKFLEGSANKIKMLIYDLKQNQDYEYNYMKIKVIGKVLKIFNTFIKSRYLNFSVFQLFENDKFLNYLRFNLDIGNACFEIFQLFPKYFELHIDNIFALSDSFLEIMLTYLEPDYVFNIFKQAFETTKLVQDEKFGNIELKVFHDDILLGKCRSLIYHTCSFVYEEYNLKVSSKMKENIERCLTMTADMTKEYMKLLLDALFFSNKTMHVKSILSAILYALIITNEKNFEEVSNTFLMNIAGNADQFNDFRFMFNESFNGVERKFDSLNFDKFSKNMRAAISNITSILLEGKPKGLALYNR